MKNNVLAFAGILLVFTATSFGSAVIVKQRAKEIARPGDPNNKGPGKIGPGPAQPAQGQSTTPAAAAPVVTPAMSRLVADIAAIRAKKELPAELLKQFCTDIAACAEGSARPSEDSVNKLGASLGAALLEKKMSAQEQSDLARDIATMVNGAKVELAEAQAALNGIKDILQASGVAKTELQAILNDFKTVFSEVLKFKK
jgi:hypothetical protein